MNFYPFHIGDYVSHTRHLSLLEDLAYRRLIDQYYLQEQPLPESIEKCAKLILMRDHQDEVRTVLDEFFELTEAGWISTRCDKEIEGMRKRQEIAREKANKRWSSAKADPVQSTGNAAAPKGDAAASKPDAAALLPIPTPTPIPLPTTPDGVEKPRASRLSTDWVLPDEWRTWAEQQRPDVDVQVQADGFRDFWISKSGKDATKLDWQATWRNWIRNAKSAPGRQRIASNHSGFATKNYREGINDDGSFS